MVIGAPRLVGRRSEQRALSSVLAAAKAGRSQVLVIKGEAGVGKTALMHVLREQATGCHVVSTSGVESDLELTYAGLHQICGPYLDRLDDLPADQREALATALGLASGTAPDRFLLGLSVLTLLAGVAEDRPLLCLIDDSQWLDQASSQVIRFVARRLTAEPIAMVFALRDAGEATELDAFPELVVRGLPARDAAALLDTSVTQVLDPRVRERIIAESHGNPLALIELPRIHSVTDLVFGGETNVRGEPVADRLEQAFVQRLQSLPPKARQLLSLAAAEPLGDPALLWRAAKELGITPHDRDVAERTGLLHIGDHVSFRHPLVRSAAYRSATTSERRLAHAALAAVTDRSVDGEHWAWHRAQSVVAPDEDVARALEESAERAIALGGMAAAAAFLDAAATLTPDPVRRSGRCLGAAQAKIAAGAFDDASRLLATAEMGPVGHAERATIELLRAQLLFLSDRGNEALPLLLGAAGKLEAVSTDLARDTYLDAFAAAHFAGRLAVGADARDVAVAALACDTRTSPSKRDLLLESLALTHTAGYAAAVPPACQAVQAFVSEDLSVDDALRFSWLAAATAASLWDDVAWDALTRRHLDVARKFGALSAVPLALTSRVMPELFRGNFRAAASYVAEVHALAEVTAGEGTLAPYGDVCLQALQGDERRAEALIHQCLDDVTARGEGVGINMAHWARSALLNSLGRYGEALHAAQISAAAFLEPGPPKWALAELVEAAVYARELPVAKTAMAQLSELTQASGTDWALGVEASRGALLAEGPSAEALHREAIDRLASTSMRLELARAQLLFGEFLRRGARRVDARVQLRAADEAFASMGAQAFAARARRELLATGETARKRTVDTVDQLTPQEAAIADLAAELLTNAEIGAALYISARTVEWHLRKVYAKLRVSTKRELRAARAPAAS